MILFDYYLLKIAVRYLFVYMDTFSCFSTLLPITSLSLSHSLSFSLCLYLSSLLFFCFSRHVQYPNVYFNILSFLLFFFLSFFLSLSLSLSFSLSIPVLSFINLSFSFSCHEKISLYLESFYNVEKKKLLLLHKVENFFCL